MKWGNVMKYVKEYLPYVVIIVCVILIRIYVISPVQVDGSSMVPTLQDNQILLLQKYDRKFHRFDIVVLKYGKDKLVKRIIGLPGETVSYQENQLYINGTRIEEPFLPENIKTNDFDLTSIGYNKIPQDYYFVVGDNRSDSLDSRYIGLIPKKYIEGTVHFRLFPFSTFGKIS